MTSRKIVAAFESRSAAENARSSLLDLGLDRDHISIVDQQSSQHTTDSPAVRGSFWAHLKEMFMPDDDRNTLEESIRRGEYVVVATVDDARVDEVIARLERAGAVDLNAREDQWRAGGANRGAAVPDSSGNSDVAAAQTDLSSSVNVPPPMGRDRFEPRQDAREEPREEARQEPREEARQEPQLSRRRGEDEGAAIPVVEERLRVGKREVNRGSVRVRSYIVEEPVHEEVRLREEHVSVERRPVNAPVRPVAKGAPGDLLQERTIEVTESAEQAVVGKEARVTEEVVVSKSADEHVEQIDDTVRHTRVEVDDNRNMDERRRRSTATDDPGRAKPR